MNETGYRPIGKSVFEKQFRDSINSAMPSICARAEKIGDVYFGNLDIEIWNSYVYARHLYVLQVFEGTIFFASRAVEMAINSDTHMTKEIEKMEAKKKLKRGEGWLNLTVETLKIARDKGLPVNSMLDPEELKLEKRPKYLERRNKVAHGDTM